MIKLKQLLNETDSNIKWIIGYVDTYGKVHYKVIKINDDLDSHNHFWPTIHHNKWRWKPSSPTHLNTYLEKLDDDSIDRIWQIIDKYK